MHINIILITELCIQTLKLISLKYITISMNMIQNHKYYRITQAEWQRVIKRHEYFTVINNLIQSSQAVKKSAALKKAMVKKDVKSKVAAKKWL